MRSPTSVQTSLERTHAAAGVKQQLESGARKTPGHRLLNERFMVIHQAIGVPKSRRRAAAETLRNFVEEMNRSGFVADARARGLAM